MQEVAKHYPELRPHLRTLFAGTPEERADAVRALAAVGDSWTVLLLRECAVSTSIVVAEAAMEALVTLAPEDAATAARELVSGGRSPYVELGRRILSLVPSSRGKLDGTRDRTELLGEIPETLDVLALVQALRVPDPEVQEAVLHQLGKLGDHWAVEPLVKKLRDASPELIPPILRTIEQIVPGRGIALGISILKSASKKLEHAPLRLSQEARKSLNRSARAAAEAVASMEEEGTWALIEWVEQSQSFLALEALARAAAKPALDAAAFWILQSGRVREAAIHLLGLLGNPAVNRDSSTREEALTLLRRLLEPEPSDFAADALSALNTANHPSAWETYAPRLLDSKDQGNTRTAIIILAVRKQVQHVERIKAFLSDPELRDVALWALFDLSPESKVAWTVESLKSGDVMSIHKAFLSWEGETPPSEVYRAALTAIVHNSNREYVLKRLLQRFPERWAKIYRVAMSSPLAGRAFDKLKEQDDAAVTPFLESLFRNRRTGMFRTLSGTRHGASIRHVLLQELARRRPESCKEYGLDALGDPDWQVRLAGVECLRRVQDPDTVQPLLQASRDEYEDIRAAALQALAQYEDSRVIPELVSSLDDVSDDVRQIAQEILEGSAMQLPVLRSLGSEFVTEKRWVQMRDRIEAVNRWACDVGQELLGVPIRVCNYRQGLGRTRGSRQYQEVVVEVSDTAVTTGHPHGEDIMRGLALHELGHHVCDYRVRGARTARGIARSEGLGEIFDILLDERLERILRARRPEWGVYFDRLGAYAFSQNTYVASIDDHARFLEKKPEEVRRAIERGELPGRLRQRGGRWHVLLRDRDLLRLPGAMPPMAIFLACLRNGFDADSVSDEGVRKAIALVPADLKDLSHAELIQVARQISKHLGKSDEHRLQMKRWRQRMRELREHRRALKDWMRRLAEGNQLPEEIEGQFPGLLDGAPGIRRVKSPGRVGSKPIKTRMGRRHGPSLPKKAGGQTLNVSDDPEYPHLDQEIVVPFNAAAHARTLARIRPHVQRLRQHLLHLGQRHVEEYASLRGRRLDLVQVRRVALRPTPRLLVFDRVEHLPDAYLGILIDRSGSMHGEKMERAIAFAVLLAEAARGLSGLEGHVNGFDDDTFYRLGNFERTSVASLTAGGGNNDAGALDRAADLALASRKRHKVIVQISDGSPAQCSIASVNALVEKLKHLYGIECVHVAIDQVDEGLRYPRRLDVTGFEFHKAVAEFGRLVRDITAVWG